MKKLLFSAVLLLGTMAANALPVQHSVGVVAGSLNGFEYKAYFQNKMVVAATLGVRASQSQGLASTTIYTNNSAQEYHERMGEELIENNNYKFVYWDLEVAGNIGYQDNFKVMSAGTFSWFVGGGLNFGTIQLEAFDKINGKYPVGPKGREIKKAIDAWKNMKDSRDAYDDLSSHDRKYVPSPLAFKAGLNAYAGVEFKFRNLPLIVGCDFRPGVGVAINSWRDRVVDYEQSKIYEGDCIKALGFFDWALNASVRYYF